MVGLKDAHQSKPLYVSSKQVHGLRYVVDSSGKMSDIFTATTSSQHTPRISRADSRIACPRINPTQLDHHHPTHSRHSRHTAAKARFGETPKLIPSSFPLVS